MTRDGMFQTPGCSSPIILLCVSPKWISFLFIHSTTLCVPVSIVLKETCLRSQTLPWRYTLPTFPCPQRSTKVNQEFFKELYLYGQEIPPLLLAGFSCLEAFSYKWLKGESALWGQVSGEKPRHWQGHKYPWSQAAPHAPPIPGGHCITEPPICQH